MDNLLSVRNLQKHSPIRAGLLRRQTGVVPAVDGLTFDLRQGETLSLVGESGSGKSSLARTILQLYRPTSGSVVFAGRDLTRLNRRELRLVRGQLQLLFPNPYRALNPRLSIGDIVGEPLRVHGLSRSGGQREQVNELLRRVGLNPYLAGRYPHEFSGGQRQRISLARALATTPTLLVLDDPFVALDPVLESQLIDLLAGLKAELNLTYLLLASDLRVVRPFSDRVGILYRGRLVELSSRDEIYGRPLHPYTQSLLARLDSHEGERPLTVAATASNPARLPPACRFHPHCPAATAICRQEDPDWRNLGSTAVPHWVACHHAEQFL
jgi:oligopeptide transport system ATP-binding protein